MGTKITHIVVDTLGDHTAQGWWYDNDRPKIEKSVVVEATYAYDPCVQEALDFLVSRGAKQVQVLPYHRLKSFREAA